MKLSNLVKIEEIKIPNTDLVIKIKTALSWLDQLEIDKVKDLDELKMGKFLACKLIVDWNLTDDEENKLPITEENVAKLPPEVALPILDKIFEIAKKKQVKKRINKVVGFLLSRRFK